MIRARSRRCSRCGTRLDERLAHLEALEFWMLQIERAGRGVAGAGMGRTEFLGSGPVLEAVLALPDRVRRIERVVLGFRPLEQVKFDEPRHAVEVRLATGPDLLERVFGSL